MKTYRTIEAAAIAGLAEAVPLAQTNGWEYGGFIRMIGGRYVPLAPITSKEAGGVSLQSQEDELTGGEEKIGTFKPPHHAPLEKQIAAYRAWVTGVSKSIGVVSSYHTHGCDWDNHQSEPNARVFSLADLMITWANSWEASYIAVACTGNVYRSPPVTSDVFFRGFLAHTLLGTMQIGEGKLGTLVGNIWHKPTKED